MAIAKEIKSKYNSFKLQVVSELLIYQKQAQKLGEIA